MNDCYEQFMNTPPPSPCSPHSLLPQPISCSALVQACARTLCKLLQGFEVPRSMQAFGSTSFPLLRRYITEGMGGGSCFPHQPEQEGWRGAMPRPSGFVMAPPCERWVVGCFDAPNIQNRLWRGGGRGGPLGTQGKGAGADARTMRNKGGWQLTPEPCGTRGGGS